MKLFRLTLAVFLIILSLSCTKEKDSKEEFAIFGLLGTVIANDSTQKASIIGTVHLIGEVQGAKVELYKLPANLLCSPEGMATETPLVTTTTNEVGYYNLSISVSALPQNGCLLATPQANSTHLNSFTAVKEKWENSPRGESSKYLASLIRFDLKSLVTKPTAYTSTSFGKTAGTVSTNVSTQYTVENICSTAGTNYNGLLPHPDTIANGSSSEKYISCLDGVATENTCKTGTYNSALGTCSQSIGAYSSVVEKFSAAELSEVSGVLTAGGKIFDLVKDDTSCNSKTNGLTETNFCSVVGVCYNNQLYTRTCPSVGGVPLQYDPATASCTYPVNANCQERFVSRETAVFTANINTVSSMAQLQYWVDTFPQTESSLSSVLRSIGIRAGLSEAFCATLISRANASVNSLISSFVGLDNSVANGMKNVFRAILAELTKKMGGDMDKALALLREDMSDGFLDGKTASGKTVSAKLENGKTLTLDQNAYSGLVDSARTNNLITQAEAERFRQNAIKYFILVNVTGLTGTGLVLQLNGGNDLTISQNGISQFSVSLAYASSYTVGIKNGSTSDSCTINSGSSGTIGTANITLIVSCIGAVVRPTFNPPEGTYKSDQLITLSTTTAGATIYYTLDGTDPTTSSTQYSSPIPIAGHATTKTIKAIATKTGILNSSVGSATYTITYDPVAQPTFSPPAGTYNSDQSVTISTITAGAVIYYTLDGSEPTTSSAQYSSPISIAGHNTTKTVKAIAVKTGMANSSASATYIITYDSVAQPTFSPVAGTYNSDQSVTISTTTAGATIYYTLDGSDPTTSSTQYSTAISIAGDGTNKTIKAIAVKTGILNSNIVSAPYTINYLATAQPTFSPAAGTYNITQNVTLSTITADATIRYTADGSDPTCSTGFVYSTAITVTASTTLKAIGCKTGFTTSSIASGAYTINMNLMGGSVNRQLNLTGAISVFAGPPNGTTTSGDLDGTGTEARFFYSHALTTDGANLYVSDTGNHKIRKIVIATGEVSVFAGPAIGDTTSGDLDGIGTTARFNYPAGITTDGTNLYVADHNNRKIRKIVIATREVSVFAGPPEGSGTALSGDVDGIGTAARFRGLNGITTDGINLYVVDSDSNKIRKVVIATRESTILAGPVAGTFTSGDVDGTGNAARFNIPNAITTDGTNLYVSEYSNNKIRKIVIATGQTTVFAGPATGTTTSGDVDGTGNAARFNSPKGLTSDGINLYIVDQGNHKVRKAVIATGAVSVLAGPAAGTVQTGDLDGTGSAARFNFAGLIIATFGMACDGTNCYIPNFNHNRIHKIQ